jgi:hypothetical protein
MRPEALVQIAIALFELAFFAGGIYFLVRQTRKDVNGLGQKVRELERREDERYLATAVAFLLVAAEKDRQFLAARFLEAGRAKK